MATNWWVGAYIESAAGSVPVTGNASTSYLPFVFSATDKATATKNAGARLLAGPFPTQTAAQTWANNYERNPATYHASSTGNHPGDTPPAPLTGINAIGDFFSKLGQPNTWIRIVKVIIGGALVLVGIAHISGLDNAVANTARKIPLPI